MSADATPKIGSCQHYTLTLVVVRIKIKIKIKRRGSTVDPEYVRPINTVIMALLVKITPLTRHQRDHFVQMIVQSRIPKKCP